jgi:hypothetical protein
MSSSSSTYRQRSRVGAWCALLGAALTLLVGSCAGPRPARASSSSATTFTALCADDVDVAVRGVSDDVERVAAAVPDACARLTRAGLTLAGAVPIHIHDDVDRFVAATGQLGDTVRAWSTIDGVHLLTLASWYAADDETLQRRLAHELCHVALFRRTRAGRPPPRAIAEGLCSVVATQDDERLPRDDVRRRTAAGERPDFDADSVFAYGVAHHVVAGIGRCRGRAFLLEAIDAMATGVDVTAALGAPPLAFLEDACPGGASSPEALHSPP